jgi:hypothetical protein
MQVIAETRLLAERQRGVEERKIETAEKPQLCVAQMKVDLDAHREDAECLPVYVDRWEDSCEGMRYPDASY